MKTSTLPKIIMASVAKGLIKSGRLVCRGQCTVDSQPYVIVDDLYNQSTHHVRGTIDDLKTLCASNNGFDLAVNEAV